MLILFFINELVLPTTTWLDSFILRNNLSKKKEETLENDRHKNGTSQTVKLLFISQKEFSRIRES